MLAKGRVLAHGRSSPRCQQSACPQAVSPGGGVSRSLGVRAGGGRSSPLLMCGPGVRRGLVSGSKMGVGCLHSLRPGRTLPSSLLAANCGLWGVLTDRGRWRRASISRKGGKRGSRGRRCIRGPTLLESVPSDHPAIFAKCWGPGARIFETPIFRSPAMTPKPCACSAWEDNS